jgi:transcriptional regulator of acetoin/glycerol metabolism
VAPLAEVTSSKDLWAKQRKLLVDTLQMCGWNRTEAARILGISRGTLLKRLDMFELPGPRRTER